MNRTIIINNEHDVIFSNMPRGAIFIWDGQVYMKIDTVFDKETDGYYNSIQLSDGDLWEFDDDDSLTDSFKYLPNIKEISMR